MLTSTLVLLPLFTLGALTPAKVSDVKANPSALSSTKAPALIYVDSFSIDPAAPKPSESAGDSDSGGGTPHLFGRLRGGEQNTFIGQRREEKHEATLEKLPGQLQTALVKELNKSIAKATVGDGGDSASEHEWVITGKFVVVDTGNSAAQAGIGFGAGKSEIQVEARVYVLSHRSHPFLTFDSKGASGHMPGAVMTHNPYVAAAKFVMSKKEPEKEAKKVAKSIAEAIGKFMAAQGIPTLK